MLPHLPCASSRFFHIVVWAFFLLCAFPIIDAKFHTREVRITADPKDPARRWRYVSKFSYGLGTGGSHVRLRSLQPGIAANIVLEIYFDEAWPEVEAMETCRRTDKAKLTHSISLPADGSWTEIKNNTYHQTIRPHVWFFAISMCGDAAGDLAQVVHRVQLEMHFHQADGSHFSYESRWELTTNICAFLVFIFFSFRVSVRCVRLRQSNGRLHPVVAALVLSIMLELVSHSFHTWHLWQYSSDGGGLPYIEVLSEVASILSQVLLSTLLIMIAWGYTLTRSKVGDLDIFIVASVLVALVHVVLVIVGKIQDDDHYKFHEHEGFHGWLLFGLRFALFAVFLWASSTTMGDAGSREQLRRFMSLYILAGSAYFLSYPTVFLLVRIFAAYLQNAILQAGLVTMQVASIYCLAEMFLLKDSLYFQASAMNRSELPRRRRSVDHHNMPSELWSRLRGGIGGGKRRD